MGKKHLNEFQKGQILQAFRLGLSGRAIAEDLGVSKTAVYNFLRRYRATGSIARKKGSGRKKKFDVRLRRRIIREVRRNRFISVSDLRNNLGIQDCCDQTIRDIIRSSGGFNSYWAVRKPFISAANRVRRVQWAQEHLNWSLNEWRKVLWSDESPFVLRFNSKKKRVWRVHNERYNPECTVGTVKHDKKINVWGAFNASGVGMLHRIEGTLVKEGYLNILENVMLPSADMTLMRENWYFQQDNDPKHTAHVVRDWMHDNNIPLLDWPSQSPDLNPIENLWSILDARCKARRPNNETELFQILQDAWRALPVSLLDDLVTSMPRRCQAVIDAEGRATKY